MAKNTKKSTTTNASNASKSNTRSAIAVASTPLKGEDKTSKAEQVKSSEAIKNILNVISTTRKTLEDKVAEAAARIVVHAVKFGDVTLAGRLISALDGSGEGKTIVRGNMMRAWFEQFGPFRFDTESKAFKLNQTKRTEMLPRVKDAKATAKLLGELNKARAWVNKPEVKYVPYDFLAEAKRFVAAAKRQIEKKKDDPKSNVIGYDIFLKAMEEAEKARIKAEAEALSKVEAVANA
jgi:hypothetical protein